MSTGDSFLEVEVKRPGRETDHSLPSNTEVKNAWSHTPFPHTSSWLGFIPLPLLAVDVFMLKDISFTDIVKAAIRTSAL
jgi:hypothetical protein